MRSGSGTPPSSCDLRPYRRHEASTTLKACDTIVYESMYGNTHVVADHIAEARSRFDVDGAFDAATGEKVRGVDLLVVGGPTHVHAMSSEKSREGRQGRIVQARLRSRVGPRHRR